MRIFIKNYIDAKKRQKLEETGEEGFSLIELIIVVVILGILVAIAIPLFASIQDTAENNALRAAAANGASAAAAEIAAPGATLASVQAAAASGGDTPIVTALVGTNFTDVTSVCVTATAADYNGSPVSAGPAC